MTHPTHHGDETNRRQFLAQAAGLAAGSALWGWMPTPGQAMGDLKPHFQPRAQRAIWLFQSGGPSQIDLFDPKPLLQQRHGEELPASIRMGQRLTAMSGNQSSLPLVGSPFQFAAHGDSGAQFSELLPHTAGIADKLCIVRSLHTRAINHDPAITFVQTGSEIAGRPSIGAWLSYGLGAGNPDLPASIAMVTQNKSGQPLYARLWGAGFLPSQHQGIQFRPGKDPVLFLKDPDGLSRVMRRQMLDALLELHRLKAGQDDSDVTSANTRNELAWRMQSSIPEVADLSDEPEEVFELYGPDSRTPGTYANNCILARRLAERGVRFTQLFHQGWDQHGNLPGALRTQCRETDQASAALVIDLERRGLLDDTLVIWGGEFGRTSYCQGKLTPQGFGRDHHPRCFTMWMAGGGVNEGLTYGSTDDLGYNITDNPMDVHDLQATILHILGIDHERLTYKFQGRRYRLTDVHGKVIEALLG
ncbi:MAG: sulfatase [Planctomycetes bacterium]|nr:sulfatase [Planctomycetota bacterium]